MQVPEHAGSVVAAHKLSCPEASGISVPWPGIKPMSPALLGRFLTTGPPGKSLSHYFKSLSMQHCSFCSVFQLCPTLCDSTGCSMPGFPVLHYLPEFAQTHVHWIGDVTQSSHLLLSPSPPAFNISQHQGLFQWIGFSSQVVKVLELQLQINIHSSFPLGLTGLIYSTYCHPIYQDLTPYLSGFWL